MASPRARNAKVTVLIAAIAAGSIGISACDGILGLTALRVGCTEGDVQCFNNTPQRCDALGNWIPDAPCAGTTCIDGACRGQCAPGTRTCDGNTNTPLRCNPLGEWVAEAPCMQSTCVMGACVVVCMHGDLGCSTDTNTPQTCNANGAWQDVPAGACVNQTCNAGACTGECSPGKRCADNTPQACDANGLWQSLPPCDALHYCEAGECLPICTPGDVRCLGNIPQTCNAAGGWEDTGACIQRTCLLGECVGICAPGDTVCSGNTRQTCDAMGQWQNEALCPDGCAGGACTGPSCAGLPEICGPAQNENCCLSPPVPGSTYNRSNDASYPATVSDFRLDRFEVTVGRFRNFVNAYPGSKPAMGAGEHPSIPGSGWDSAWDQELPVDQAALIAEISMPCPGTWADPTGIEQLPINCVTWFMAFAFCAWDGSRLPTEAEWNYAAAGGSEQRQYPWSNPPSSPAIDTTYAVYGCNGDGNGQDCNYLVDIVKVGTKPPGDGKWGQADLAGNVWEWTLDAAQNPYMNPCNDCALLYVNPNDRVSIRGGSWIQGASILLSSFRNDFPPAASGGDLGFRCARTP